MFFFHFRSFTFHILFGLLYPFSIWTFISLFYFDFCFSFLFQFFSILFQFFFSFDRGHILDFFQFLFYFIWTIFIVQCFASVWVAEKTTSSKLNLFYPSRIDLDRKFLRVHTTHHQDVKPIRIIHKMRLGEVLCPYLKIAFGLIILIG